jgi:hypothetical protein
MYAVYFSGVVRQSRKAKKKLIIIIIIITMRDKERR